MSSEHRKSLRLILAGIVTWAVVTGLALYMAMRSRQAVDGEVLLFTALAVTNLASMLYTVLCEKHSLVSRRIAHGLQLLSVFAAAAVFSIDFLPIYSIVWIAIVPGLYSNWTSWWLLAGVMLGWYLMTTLHWGNQSALFGIALYATFHLFALLSSRVAIEAEEARDKVEFLNSELVASQHLLSEASRQSERTRIARDLHDLLGHHLTALSINLQIAERLADGQARDKIGESRALARLLLSDVRDAVSTLREQSAVDFTQAVRLLVERVPQLDIELDIQDGLAIDEFEIAESLLRCIQEALTNTLRHAGASKSWIRVWREADRLCLDVRDNGSGAADIVEGNGLKGMRERLEQLSGSLALNTSNDALQLRATIPVP